MDPKGHPKSSKIGAAKTNGWICMIFKSFWKRPFFYVSWSGKKGAQKPEISEVWVHDRQNPSWGAQYLEPWLSFGRGGRGTPWSNILIDIYKYIYIYYICIYY